MEKDKHRKKSWCTNTGSVTMTVRNGVNQMQNIKITLSYTYIYFRKSKQ